MLLCRVGFSVTLYYTSCLCYLIIGCAAIYTSYMYTGGGALHASAAMWQAADEAAPRPLTINRPSTLDLISKVDLTDVDMRFVTND